MKPVAFFITFQKDRSICKQYSLHKTEIAEQERKVSA